MFSANKHCAVNLLFITKELNEATNPIWYFSILIIDLNVCIVFVFDKYLFIIIIYLKYCFK